MSLLSENILKELITDNFACLSRINQIEGFLRSLYDAGHTKVTPQEITQLFKDANMRPSQSPKKIRCGVFKVREYLDSMTTSKDDEQVSRVSIKRIADDLYKISLKN
jgi:hypothetical protein